MTTPQGGILGESRAYAFFVTLDLAEGEAAAAALREAAAVLPEEAAALTVSDPEAGLLSSIAFGEAVWPRLFGASRPRLLRPFKALADGPRKAPATAADVLLHLRANRFDLCFELARRFRKALGGAVRLVEEIEGFRYLNSRDLTGFVDGTENPAGEARAAVALVGAEDSAFAGGSYVAVQRYIHNLAAWEELPVTAQEDIIARTKTDDIEYDSDKKPPDAHIKRVNIKEDGKSVEILRHSMPYGGVDEHGLYFIAYAASSDNFDKMLAQMIEADAEGHYDHLMNFSRAVTGCNFFAPAEDWLRSQG